MDVHLYAYHRPEKLITPVGKIKQRFFPRPAKLAPPPLPQIRKVPTEPESPKEQSGATTFLSSAKDLQESRWLQHEVPSYDFYFQQKHRALSVRW